MLKQTLWTAAFVLGAIPSARAVRLEFIAQYRGERVSGAEACFWKAGEASDPLALFLSSDDVRCVSADDVLEIPVGRWFYYMRKGTTLVHAEPSLITNTSHSMDERGYKQDIDETHVAGAVDVSGLGRAEGEALAVYISNDRGKGRPMLVPIPRNATRVTVPAEMPLVVVAARGRTVTRVTAPFVVPVGGMETLKAASSMESAVVAWVTFPSEARKPGDYWHRLGAPKATLEGNGESIDPVLPLFPSYSSDGALLVFRNVPKGPWTIKLSGTGWRPDELPVDVGSSAFVNAGRLLHTAPVSSLRVRWSVGTAVGQDDFCAPPARKESKSTTTTIRLFTCPDLQPGLPSGAVDRTRCRPNDDVPDIDPRVRIASFDAVVPGTYLVEVREPALPVRRATVTLAIGETSTVDLELKTFDFFGRLTVDGKPIAARLEFATGYAVSDASGSYQARLDDAPRNLRVRVVRCEDDSLLYTDLPREPIRPNTAYDIDVRSNTIRVRVIDDETQQPLEGAIVSCGVRTDDRGGGEFLAGVDPTDKQGETEIANAPADRPLLICAQAVKYERRCISEFVMGGSRDRSETIAVARKRHRGKLLVSSATAHITFVAADGRAMEKVPVNPDGTFDYRNDYAAPEYVVVSGGGLPLFVVPLPTETPEVLEIAPPKAPLQSLKISISNRSIRRNALIGIAIGGLYVTDAALFEHQSSHGQQVEVVGKGPLLVPEISAAAPIDVILGPDPQEYPSDVPTGVDIFTLPQYRQQFPTKRVDRSGSVVFDQ